MQFARGLLNPAGQPRAPAASHLRIVSRTVAVLLCAALSKSAWGAPPPLIPFPPPRHPPLVAACTINEWIPADRSWTWRSVKDGTTCKVDRPGVCEGGICHDCLADSYQATLKPTYLVLGLVYSPPGCTGCNANVSKVQYSTAGTVGTAVSVEKSFSQDYSESVSTKYLGVVAGDFSQDYSTTDTTSNVQSISQTNTNGIILAGNQDGINHDQDTFIILLNPAVEVDSGETLAGIACAANMTWRVGQVGTSPLPYRLTVHDLKNFDGLPADEAAVMQTYGITKADFATILALDPFANDTKDARAAIDPNRYAKTVHSFSYQPPDTDQNCDNNTCSCMTASLTQIDTVNAQSTHGTKTSYQVGLKETLGNDNAPVLGASVTLQQKFTWTANSSITNSTGTQKQATVTIPCPSKNWTAADDYTLLDVYWDTLYGTFMFTPAEIVETKPGQITTASGVVNDSTGKPLANHLVDVAYAGRVIHTSTDKDGHYTIYGGQKSTAATPHNMVLSVGKQHVTTALGRTVNLPAQPQ